MTILGVGTDVVDIPSFVEQLRLPGSYLKEVFTARERRRAKQRAATYVSAETSAETEDAGADRHLAAVWAIKEAFIKAWSGALSGQVPPLGRDQVAWSEIEVKHDVWGRPSIRLSGSVYEWVKKTLGVHKVNAAESISLHTSASHDGDVACALVVLEAA